VVDEPANVLAVEHRESIGRRSSDGGPEILAGAVDFRDTDEVAGCPESQRVFPTCGRRVERPDLPRFDNEDAVVCSALREDRLVFREMLQDRPAHYRLAIAFVEPAQNVAGAIDWG